MQKIILLALVALVSCGKYHAQLALYTDSVQLCRDSVHCNFWERNGRAAAHWDSTLTRVEDSMIKYDHLNDCNCK
jgi:hypothetical protein